MNTESTERGLTQQNNHNKKDAGSSNIIAPSVVILVLLLVSCICGFLGMVGGSGKWLSSWVQMTGFPMLFIPLVVLYSRRDQNTQFFASRKFLFHAALTGLIQGIGNFMFCFGLSFLPASTVSLLITTQLIFTSLISLIWVKQKFTPNSLNLKCSCSNNNGDRPPGVTNSQYVFGFFFSIAAAAIFGFVIVSTQFQVCVAFFATLICGIGSLINQDFTAMHKEAREFGLGTKMYSLVLVSNMVVWQMMFIRRAGIIFCTSSLFAGVMSAIFSTLSQIAAVIAFHENFTGVKGMALALTLWGFTSYFFGSYKKTKKPKPVTP
ncbi:hypothetical protein MKW92_050406 [Papaver armeniacum]|nr:hypothetical protein MKW92_050406 [Papaver armeniacum]